LHDEFNHNNQNDISNISEEIFAPAVDAIAHITYGNKNIRKTITSINKERAAFLSRTILDCCFRI
jgi:hypothetical protein